MLKEQNVEERVAREEVQQRRQPRLEMLKRGRSLTAERRKGGRQAREVGLRRGFNGSVESAGRKLVGVAERTGEMPTTQKRASRRSPSIRQGLDVKKTHKHLEKWDTIDEFRLQNAVLGCTRGSIGARVGGPWYPPGPNDQMPDNVVGDMQSPAVALDQLTADAIEAVRQRQLSLTRTSITIQTPTVRLTTGSAASTQLADYDPAHLMERQAMVDPEEWPTEDDWWSYRKG